MEDTKKEPYKTKGYTQNTKTQKPKRALKEKPFLSLQEHVSNGGPDHCRSATTMAGPMHHLDPALRSLC
jgi:hypothetical protein